MQRRPSRGISVVMLLLVLIGCTGGKKGPQGTTPHSSRPNVVFVLTDDMRLDELQYMPHVQELLGARGATFDNYFDNVTLCCPARTSILRGQYSHNTGVMSNGGSNGGFETAYARGIEQATIATALHDAGYKTGLFGKYLNGYPNVAGASYIPPGWDRWSSPTGGSPYSEYEYTLNEDGKQVSYGTNPSDYGTNVYMREAKDFISQASGSGTPFFAFVPVYAPHQPATPALQDSKAFVGLQAPRDAAYDEADVTDKPAYIQAQPLLTQSQEQKIDLLYRKRVQSLQAVDRGVASLVDELRSLGQLDNTYLIFASDNGFHLGQHRMPSGKETAYETDIHLPLLVAGPGVVAGSHPSAIAGNVDLAPTIADLAGTTMTDNPDGRSLVPQLQPAKQSTTTAPSRQAYLLEHWAEIDTGDSSERGGAPTEPADPDETAGTAPSGAAPPGSTAPRRSLAANSPIPEFQGLRLATFAYVEYVTGERELYDVAADPDELVNLATTSSPAFLAALHDRLDALRNCAGDTCRAQEDLPAPSPP